MSSVLSLSDKNLSPLKKVWLKWHVKLGHLAFAHVQKLGLGGFLDKAALGLSRARLLNHPLCTSCQCGKQTRLPDNATTTSKNKEVVGSLKVNHRVPGSCTFADQLESHVRGQLLHTAGKEPDRDRFCGSTAFCDGASGHIHIEHQVTLNAADSVRAKANFERVASQFGVTVDSCHTDNGIFKSRAFVDEIIANQQAIHCSGVGAKWQNGVSKGATRIVVSKARTMMIHAALQWPDVDDNTLWPLAVSHAAHLHNHTPNPESGIAPIEIFSRTKNDCQALRNSHPWGCPVCVLEPRLSSAGGKIPKWQP